MTVSAPPRPTAAGPAVRARIAALIDAEIGAGRIFWDAGRVVDSPMPLGALPAKVRFVPTFAYRQLLYDGPARDAAACRLCAALSGGDGELPLTAAAWAPGPVPEWWERFDALFALRHNNFPYFAVQFMVAAREHVESFSVEHLRVILEFMRATDIGAAAMQVAGSGATIPDHAHISVFDEPLPLFALPRRRVAGGAVTVEAADGHPSAVFVVRTREDVEGAARLIASATAALTRAGYSHNLFLERGGDAYIVPRRLELAPSIERKVGSVEMAGVYLGNALGAQTTDLAALEEVIRARCAAVSPTRYEAALAEAGCAGTDAVAVEALIADVVREVAS